MMDNIKEAFDKVKFDILTVNREIFHLKEELNKIRESMIDLCEIVQSQKINIFNSNEQFNTPERKIVDENLYYSNSNDSTHNSTDSTHNSTDSTHNSTNKYSFKPIKGNIMPISIGNRGVSTDRQTDRQTDKTTLKEQFPPSSPQPNQDPFHLLSGLDSLKKEIRLKFKRLTEQELLVFSTIYQLEEDQGYSDYNSISQKLSLSESSIRDYVQRLIKKGIPLEKTRINNKQLHIFISKSIKNNLSLTSILNLREL